MAGPDPACLPLAIAVISGKFMSERIDVRGDIKIAGGSGDAVRGEVTALTRWVPAGQAVRSPAGAVALRVSGCAEEFSAGGGDPREPHRRLRPGLCRHDRSASHARVLHPVRAAAGAIAAARRGRRRRAAAARCGRRSGPRGPGDRGRNRRRRASRRGRRRGSRRSSVAVFPAARQARLAAAADEVAAAAQDGSAAALSRPLRRFEALTTALRTVQPGLRPAWPAPARAPGGTGFRMRTPDRGPAASGS